MQLSFSSQKLPHPLYNVLHDMKLTFFQIENTIMNYVVYKTAQMHVLVFVPESFYILAAVNLDSQISALIMLYKYFSYKSYGLITLVNRML